MGPELDFEKKWRLVREIIETIVLTLLMFLVIRLAIQNFNVDGPSMEPTLHNGELILVDKWSYLFRAPARGDVIVFVAPPNPSEDYVKRIIGLPGDHIVINGTQVYVDGVQLNETYVSPIDQGNIFGNIDEIVPPNKYFVMGDDRIRSSDSRQWGFVPRQNIIGQAALVYWPLKQDNDGFLANVSSVFANVHLPGSASIAPSNWSSAITTGIDPFLLLVAPAALLISRTKKRKSRPKYPK